MVAALAATHAHLLAAHNHVHVIHVHALAQHHALHHAMYAHNHANHAAAAAVNCEQKLSLQPTCSGMLVHPAKKTLSCLGGSQKAITERSLFGSLRLLEYKCLSICRHFPLTKEFL